MLPTKKTRMVRVPVDVLETLDRTLPDFDNPTRFRIMLKYSAVHLEDMLNGGRSKKRREFP